MTAHRDLKRIIRERRQKTGESYTAARAHVMRDRAALLGLDPDASAKPIRAEAAVLKVNRQSARVRILGEDGQVTFRSGDVWNVVPGQLVTLVIEKRWTWRDDRYASGHIENPRLAVERLGLTPLPVEVDGPVDLREGYEPYRGRDPYAALWRKHTAKPRASLVMDMIAWDVPAVRHTDEPVDPDDFYLDFEDGLTCQAAERAEAGDREGARELLMRALCIDLRCIDAHAHLGNLVFDHSPERAMLHYEIGIRIGELSLPPGFDGVVLWGPVNNRPFLRCLHGYGLCLWRSGRLAEAEAVFERILALNPHDNQGVRSCWQDVRAGRSWTR